MSELLREQLQASLGPAYPITRELGGGGMSRVFVAHDEALGRDVVVKVLAPALAEGLSAERFTREIRLAAALQEPHIVPVISAGTTADGLPWYTMPFIAGQTLRARLDEGPIPIDHAVEILHDVARALAYAHAHGIVHRDIKPENMLLSSGTAVVADFGIAKALSAAKTKAPGGTLTQIGASLGTPAYMAPEQALADPDTGPPADVYAWGVVAYELLSGRHPFAARTSPQQLIAAHISEVPPPLACDGLAPAVARLVMRALEKDAAARPAAREILDQLRNQPTGPVETPSSRGIPRRAWLAGGVALAVLALAATLTTRRRGADSPAAGGRAGVHTIAVLPLSNVGGDTANAYFADGLTDELTNAVAKLPQVRVTGGSSAAAWKGQRDVDIRDVGRKLNVDDVLTGSVRRAGSRVRIVAQLAGTRDGNIIWTESYERDLGDVFALQADIARAVAAEMKLTLGLADSTRLERGGTRDTAAHELYLRARHLHTLYGQANLRRAIALYRRAAERDPRYVEAWAGEGYAWFNLADEYIAPREAAPHVREAALRALAIDSSLGDALMLEAMTSPSGTPMRQRVEKAKRAAAAAPNDPIVQLFAGLWISSLDPSGASEVARQARTLEPLSGIHALVHSIVLQYAGRLPEAERAGRDAVTLAPDLGFAHASYGQVLLRLGRASEALAEFEKGIANGDQDMSRMGAGLALVRLGRASEARRYRTELEEAARRRYVIGEWVARLCLALGDRDAALDWLERGAREQSNYRLFIDVEPEFRTLRGDPRFEAVRRAVGLGDATR